MRLLPLLPFLLTPLAAQNLPDPEEAAYPAIERLVKVLEMVRNHHPDTDKLAYDRLVNHALEGMLSSLDPHSSFLYPEMAAILREQPELDPRVPALGLTLGWREDGPYLAAIVPHSAAAEKLTPGAGLLEIDKRPVTSLPPEAVLNQLNGPPGREVTLKVKLAGEPHPQEVSLICRAVETRVTQAHMLPDTATTGYLMLGEFNAAAPREVELALDELEEKGMKSLLLDLRGNPGGSLPATVQILGLFLPPETPVVSIRGRTQEENEILQTPARQRRQRTYPIAVLIDRDSASASELTAQALQDLKRATIVGEQSYGKGSVQNIIPTGADSALRLTIATYHTPSGRSPHRIGVTPDVPVILDEADRRRTAMARHPRGLAPEQAADLRHWTDPVILAALQALKETGK